MTSLPSTQVGSRKNLSPFKPPLAIVSAPLRPLSPFSPVVPIRINASAASWASLPTSTAPVMMCSPALAASSSTFILASSDTEIVALPLFNSSVPTLRLPLLTSIAAVVLEVVPVVSLVRSNEPFSTATVPSTLTVEVNLPLVSTLTLPSLSVP